MPDDPVTGQPAPAVEPAPAPAAPPDAGSPKPWYETDERLTPHAETLKKFKSPADAALSYVNLEKSMGRRVLVPGPDAKPEELAAWHKHLGVPEKPEGYGEYKPPEALAEVWDRAAESRFYQAAHKLGMTPAQVNGVLALYAMETQSARDLGAGETKKQIDAAMAELRDTWGANTERNVALAQQTVQTLGDASLAEVLNQTGLGNHPAMLKFLARVGEGLVEDGIIKGDLVGKTSESAQQEIGTLMASKAWGDASDPQHAQVMQQISDLYKIAYPSI